jgi:hypothetical protein
MRTFVVTAMLVAPALAFSQDQAQQQVTIEKRTGMTASLNKSLGIYVFPAKDQDSETQAKDEQACYTWAVEQSGVDPLNMQQVKPDSVATGPDGSAVRGAARGAVAGVAIGAIAGDAGKGAAIGAAAGGMGGLAGKRHKDAAEKEKAAADANAKEQAMTDSFKKAYSACLEGKGYTVK